MILVAKNRDQALSIIAPFVLDRLVCKELGEPVLFDEGDVFYAYKQGNETLGFAAINIGKNTKLKYIYVKPDERGNGIFSELHDRILKDRKGDIYLVATNTALPIYLKKGYEIQKSFTNYHNLCKRF